MIVLEIKIQWNVCTLIILGLAFNIHKVFILNVSIPVI